MAEFKIERIQIARDEASDWSSNNPTLYNGEFGFESDTGKLKIGDGATDWNSLDYLDSGSGGGGGFTTEEIQDIVDSLIIGGNGITKTYNDASNTLTLELTGEIYTSNEKTKLSNIEDGAQVNPDDASIVTSVDTQLGNTNWQNPLTQEQVQDFMATALTGGNQTNISVTYNDAGNTFDFFVSGGGSGTGFTQEEIEDIVDGLIINGNGISKVYDDATGVLTLSLSGENYTTSEKNKLAGIESGATADQLAADVPITDAGGNFTAINVEAALLELFNNKSELSGTNTFSGFNHFTGPVTTGDSGFHVGEDEGISGQRWRVTKDQASDSLTFGVQDNASASTFSTTFSVVYSLNDSGTPADNTDLITKAYADANYTTGTDNLGNHIATQDLNMSENDILNTGIVYVNGTSTNTNDFIIGRSDIGSYFYDEESYNSVNLGRFNINASTGAGTYEGDFDASGSLTQDGAPVILSDTTGVTGATAISNWITVSQSEYDAIVSPDPNTIYYIEDAVDPSIPVSSTGTSISLATTGGNYMNMSSANTATTYTTTGETLGGWAKVLINAASQPTITGATNITGSTFASSTDMYMYVTYNGNVVEYWFEEI